MGNERRRGGVLLEIVITTATPLGIITTPQGIPTTPTPQGITTPLGIITTPQGIITTPTPQGIITTPLGIISSMKTVSSIDCNNQLNICLYPNISPYFC